MKARTTVSLVAVALIALAVVRTRRPSNAAITAPTPRKDAAHKRVRRTVLVTIAVLAVAGLVASAYSISLITREPPPYFGSATEPVFIDVEGDFSTVHRRVISGQDQLAIFPRGTVISVTADTGVLTRTPNSDPQNCWVYTESVDGSKTTHHFLGDPDCEPHVHFEVTFASPPTADGMVSQRFSSLSIVALDFTYPDDVVNGRLTSSAQYEFSARVSRDGRMRLVESGVDYRLDQCTEVDSQQWTCGTLSGQNQDNILGLSFPGAFADYEALDRPIRRDIALSVLGAASGVTVAGALMLLQVILDRRPRRLRPDRKGPSTP